MRKEEKKEACKKTKIRTQDKNVTCSLEECPGNKRGDNSKSDTSCQEVSLLDLFGHDIFLFDHGSLISLSKSLLKKPSQKALYRIMNQVIRCNLPPITAVQKISTLENLVGILLITSHFFAHAASCVSCVLGSKCIRSKQLQNVLLEFLPKSKSDLPCFDCIEFGRRDQYSQKTEPKKQKNTRSKK